MYAMLATSTYFIDIDGYLSYNIMDYGQLIFSNFITYFVLLSRFPILLYYYCSIII